MSSRSLGADLLACIGFYTRLPVGARVDDFAAAQWAAPVAGAVVGLISSLVLLACLWAGIPATVAAAIALGVAMLATGALHEDGLADLADGFGGGRSRDEKLTIMRDSRIGTYGVLALGTTILIKWAALASLAGIGAGTAFFALLAAHTASRALMVLFTSRVEPAREDGLSANLGRIEGQTALVALLIGAASLVLLGAGLALLAAILLAVWFWGLERLCRHQIGGQTGDVLGTLQQGGEIAILVTASAILT
ncbi:adenosylcobinamide-GDP ribazoletransferase [Chelativorans sp. YIM 93263]|uniref:adenosylcobinamide-GDP ribazoletransferase n=1 Tax=Chelativorans sp. YIM 93263 TaxID=2906648 RepID=UPI00403DD7A6